MADQTRLEEDGIRAVVSHLVDVFTDSASPEQVKAAVDAQYRRFDHSRVRQYVPLLVEHGARDDLRARAV